jgi:hypothetical protein
MSPNPFAAAAAKAAAAPQGPKGKKESNIVIVTEPDVATAMDEFVEADGREKQAKADKEVAKSVASPFCIQEFIKQFSAAGRKPETLKFRTQEGNGVTLVVQDRGERYKVSPEQHETLRALLGDEAVENIVVETTTFSFNNEVLAKPGVMDAFAATVTKLVEAGVLTSSEAENVLTAEQLITIRKGALDDLARLCDKDSEKMATVLDALGSHCSAYIKA